MVSQKGLFSRKLNLLFAEKRKENGEPYTDAEVEVGTAMLGERVTVSYLSRLRKGSSQNPTFGKIKVLSKFFGVEPNYFFNEDAEKSIDSYATEQKELDLLALRASNIENEEMRSMMLKMLEVIGQTRKDENQGEGVSNID